MSEEKYEFVSQMDIETAIRCLKFLGEYRAIDLFKKVLAERDAYRQGWADLYMSEFQVSRNQTIDDFLQTIDAEARKLLTEDGDSSNPGAKLGKSLEKGGEQ